MTIHLTDNQAFDNYAAMFGWTYDNAGHYLGQSWDWYVGPVAGFVLMRQPPDRIALVRYDGCTPSEVWSDQIRTDNEFDQIMARVGLTRQMKY